MQLPKDSRNEQLETISVNKLRSLFPVDKFILKKEDVDNGVDFRGEIKKDGLKYGFGFTVQLKSSESIDKNKDGSYSKSIDVSNIEYLINNAQPAYYCFYENKGEQFYYLNLFEFIKDINERKPEWADQKTVKIRFRNILNSDAVEKIYTEILHEGNQKRRQSQFLTNQNHNLNRDYKFVIDEKGNGYSDIENILFIEEKGFYLNQSFNWKEVIEIHEKISETSFKSPTYHLTVAIAYYNIGNYFKSRLAIRNAEKNSSEIAPILIPHLKFYKLELDKIFGFSEEINYKNILSSPDIDDSLKNHLKLDEIVQLKYSMYSDENFQSLEFEEGIEAFLMQPNLERRFNLMAHLEITTYFADQLICLIPKLSRLNGFSLIEEKFQRINKAFTEIQREQLEVSNESDVYILALRHFKFLIHFNTVAVYAFQVKKSDSYWKKIEKLVLTSLDFFNKIRHLENQLFALQTLLEFYLLMDDIEEEKSIRNQLLIFKTEIDIPYYQDKINFILTGGTFVENVKKDFSSFQEEFEEIKKMKAELEALDKSDSFTKPKKEGLTIELFPVGHFYVPNDKLNLFFYDIVKITDRELIDHIVWMGSKVIPVLNILIPDIKNEGRGEGMVENRGILNYQNMYRIRKQLFEFEIKRVKINFPNF
ncbi:MAG TPA: DUF4365 domain-containing protein [Salinimicrobium sp.]|nr:DUF4365 domain-containing protein [Salinimicrobium sp.]